MTKAQKENQARFKKVQAEAKKLKAKNPRLTHIEAVKRAWAAISPKSGNKPKTKSTVGFAKKKVAKKKVAKKISGKLSLTRKETRLGYVGKVPAKKKAASKKTAVSKHKDVKSHNVRISVMSGVGKYKMYALGEYTNAVKRLEQMEKIYAQSKFLMNTPKYKDEKPEIKKELVKLKKAISEYKIHVRELKKLL